MFRLNKDVHVMVTLNDDQHFVACMTEIRVYLYKYLHAKLLTCISTKLKKSSHLSKLFIVYFAFFILIMILNKNLI